MRNWLVLLRTVAKICLIDDLQDAARFRMPVSSLPTPLFCLFNKKTKKTSKEQVLIWILGAVEL